MDVATSKTVEFLKLKNRVNVIFSRAMDGFALIADCGLYHTKTDASRSYLLPGQLQVSFWPSHKLGGASVKPSEGAISRIERSNAWQWKHTGSTFAEKEYLSTYMLGKNMNVMYQRDFYERCSEKAMTLLDTTIFNKSQKEAVQYLRQLPNGMGIIIGPVATGKTTFIENVVQPFLLTKEPPSVTDDEENNVFYDADEKLGSNITQTRVLMLSFNCTNMPFVVFYKTLCPDDYSPPHFRLDAGTSSIFPFHIPNI